jgi:Uma2 family endonuclease
MATAANLALSTSDYLQGELTAQNKHELVGGETYAMAGASADHNRVSGNLYSELLFQLKGRSCEPFIADMKVSAQGDFYYPDVMVVCDKHENDSDYVKYAPKLIVEVLSKSTRVFDHTIKQAKYLKIPTLEYYVLIEQDFCEIQVLSRAAGFIPQYYYLGDNIAFELIDVAISVNDIYERIENEDKERYLQSLIEKTNDVRTTPN